MPSLAYTPGSMTLAGASYNPEPIRFGYSLGRLSLSGGSYAIGLSAAAGTKLPRLRRELSYFGDTGKPTAQMQTHWQTFAERIEARFDAIEAALEAQALAATAVQSAQAVQTTLDLSQSYINPVGVLTAASSGTITVDTHSRVYSATSEVSVTGGTVTGFVPGDYVTVFYADAARAGGGVTFQGTTSAVAQTGNIHVVGQVVVPAVGQPDVPGAGPTAPGYTPPTTDPRSVEYEVF